MEFDWNAERLEGQWWDPALPSKAVGGGLARDDDGVLELHLLGWPGEWRGMQSLRELPKILHGRVGAKPVTLFGCRPLRGNYSSASPEPSSASIAIGVGFGGAHIGQEPDARFANATVRIQYLNEWSNRRAFSFNQEHQDRLGDSPGFVYTQHETLSASIPGAEVLLERGYSGTVRDDGLSSAEMVSNENLVFDFGTPVDVETIDHEYLRPVANMLMLSSRRPCPTLDLRVAFERSRPGNGIVVLGRRHSDPKGRTQHSSQLLFRRDDLGFDVTLARWFELHQQLGIVCDLLASLREPGNLANHFLNIASALESYHRRTRGRDKPSAEHKARLKRIAAAVDDADTAWLSEQLRFSHQPTYLSRLQDLLADASTHLQPNIGDPDVWAKWVKNGRNSVAHRDPGMVDVEKEWRATHAITRSAEWLLVILLLQDMGLPEHQIANALRQQQSWGFLREHLRYAVPTLFE